MDVETGTMGMLVECSAVKTARLDSYEMLHCYAVEAALKCTNTSTP